MLTELGEQQQGDQGKKKKVAKLFTLNLFTGYIITGIQAFLYIGIGMLTLLILETFVLNRKKIYHRTSKRDGFHLFLRFLRMNKKFILASMVGLVLATLVISHTIVFSISYRQAHLDNYLQQHDSEFLHMEFYSLSEKEYDNWDTFFSSNIEQWLGREDLQLQYFSSTASISFELVENIVVNEGVRTVNWLNVLSHNMNEKLQAELLQFPSFPSSYMDLNSVLMIIDENQLKQLDANTIQSKSSFQILLEQDVQNRINASRSFLTESLVSDIVWVVNETDRQYARDHDLFVPYNALVLTQSKLWEIYHKLETTTLNAGQKSGGWGSLYSIIDVYIEHPILKEKGLETYIESINKFKDKLDLRVNEFVILQGIEYYTISKQTPLLSNLEEYQVNSLHLFFIMMLMNLPIILLTFYLLKFAFSMLTTLKEKLVFTFVTRGVSSTQINGMTAFESFLGALMATLVGMLLSIPVILVALATSGLLDYDFSTISLVIPETWYWQLPALGSLISLNFSLLNQLDSTRMMKSEEQRHHRSWRNQIPVVLLVLAIIIWLYLDNSDISGFNPDLFFFFGEIIILVIIVSLPLTLGAYLIQLLGQVDTSSREFVIYQLAIHRLRSRGNVSRQFIAIMIAAFLIAFTSSATAISLSRWNDLQRVYNTGADVRVDVPVSNLNTISDTIEFLDGVKQIIGIRGVSPFIKGIYAQTTHDVSSGENPRDYVFLGISAQSFEHVAHWDKAYSSHSFNEIRGEIDSLIGVGIQKKERQLLELSIGDNLVINYGGEGVHSTSLSILTDFDYWPNLVDKSPSTFGNQGIVDTIHAVGDFKTIQNLLITITKRITIGIYISIDENYDRASVISELNIYLQSINVFSIIDSSDVSSEFFTYHQINYMLSALQSILFFSMIVALLSVFYYRLLQVSSQQRELALLRVLGLTNHATKYLVLAEIFIIILSSFSISIIAARVVSSMILSLLVITQTISSSLPILLRIGILPTSIMGISTLITGYFLSRKQTSKHSLSSILRQEVI